MNASHAVRETYAADKKSDNEQLGCDGTFDFQSVSPADYQHKVIHSARTADRGILTHLASSLPYTVFTECQLSLLCRHSVLPSQLALL